MKEQFYPVRLSSLCFCPPFFCPRFARITFLFARVAVIVAAISLAALLPLSAAEPDVMPPSVALAAVDGIPITSRDVQRELDRAVQGRDLSPAALQSLCEAALKQLIDRRLVGAYLKQNGFAARPQELDRQLQRVRKRLEQQQLTRDQYLQRCGLSANEFRDSLDWQIAWPRFLERYLTDENLARYFEQHRRDFDGTEVSAAHILFRIEPSDDARMPDAAIAAAQRLRTRLQAGELSFPEAAQQHSAAPTAADAGRLGFIGRHQPMPEAFTQAAFALEPGAISPPVVTASGVHLIQCVEVKPGTKGWQEVRAELETAVTQHLFRWAADRQRASAKIEIR